MSTIESRPSAAGDELALVLSGGGARAAYQAGVLSGIARRWPDLAIPILTGVSAGSINQAYLATHRGNLRRKAHELTKLWAELHTERVFAVGSLGLFSRVLYWGMRLVSGGHFDWGYHGMVDSQPLRETLTSVLQAERGVLTGIRENLADGSLSAVAVTTASYTTGQSITWVQGRSIDSWERADRKGVSCELTVEHVLASAALPLFYPAIRIGGDYYGDGGMRLTAPLSPAIHLGAGRILAISTRYLSEYPEYPRIVPGPLQTPYPPPAQIAGVLLGTIFLDQFEGDGLRLARINDLIERLPEGERDGLRPVRLLVLRPSRDLGLLARDYEPRLPRTFRWLERGLGTREANSNVLLSLVMFQRDYARRLIALGEEDAERHAEALAAFLEE